MDRAGKPLSVARHFKISLSDPGRLAARLLLSLALFATGCATQLDTLGAGLAFERALLPLDQTLLDLPYRVDPAAHPDKHRLDLFLPDPATTPKSWPTLIFIHGGGWTSGDRAMSSFGIDPMRNIGRFYAKRGIGTAIVSYRLQPDASWREQIDDVAEATAWVRREIAAYGGDPDALILSGHSAGAWLAAWLGLNDAPLAEKGVARSSVCGVVLVSGAAYDLADSETYALGASRRYFAKRFKADREDWQAAASIRAHVDHPSPPTLILNAEGEAPTFARQANLLFDALDDSNALSRRHEIPGQDHRRIVVSMSLEGNPVSASILDFLNSTACLPPSSSSNAFVHPIGRTGLHRGPRARR